MKKLISIDFGGGGDGTTILYVDGKLEMYGDYYHDKIDDKINGFAQGLEHMGEEISIEILNVEDHPIADEGWVDDPPKTIEELGDYKKYQI